MDLINEQKAVECTKPFIVWERHALSNEKLGKLEGDVPHYFWTYEKARTFMTTIMALHPDKAPYIRIIQFSPYCQGYDFGSYCDFIVLESRTDVLPD